MWRLLLTLSSAEVVNLLDLSYLEDVLDRPTALQMLSDQQQSRSARMEILERGYPGYDTSVGWYNYDDDQVFDKRSTQSRSGIRSLQIKGWRRSRTRPATGARSQKDCRTRGDHYARRKSAMVFACCNHRVQGTRKHQSALDRGAHASGRHTRAQTTRRCNSSHRSCSWRTRSQSRLCSRITLKRVALDSCNPIAPDSAEVSEFLTVSLLAQRYGVPVVPHVGDMGQIHQHLVLFNHIAIGHPETFSSTFRT